jgi:serine O-acetyltransferase
MPLKSVLLADLGRQWAAAGRPDQPATWLDVLRAVGNLRFAPVVLCRLAGACEARRWRLPARTFSFVNQVLFGVEVALRLDIGPGLYFPHSGGIVLGAARVGRRATIYHGVTLGAAVLDVGYDVARRPTIGDDVVIAAGAKVLGGVAIGDGAVIGANAVVVSDVPAMAVVGGVPAQVLRYRDEVGW